MELQLDTATNHHRSLAVLKFLVPLHLKKIREINKEICKQTAAAVTK